MAEDQNRTLQDKFMLRLPEGMRDRIKAASEVSGRSMNAEIVARIEQSFQRETAMEEMLVALDSRMRAIEAEGQAFRQHLRNQGVRWDEKS